MTRHGSHPDDAAADLRRLAFDEPREDCRSNPGEDDGRIAGFDGVDGDPDGFLRVEDLMAALFLGGQPSLHRSQVDDEILPFAASDDGRFQLADAIAVALGASEHPGGSQSRLQHGASRPRGVARGGAERNRNLDEIPRRGSLGRDGGRDLRLGVLNLGRHPLHDVTDQLPLVRIEAGAQRATAAPGGGQAGGLLHARDDFRPVHLHGEFFDRGHQIDRRLRSPGLLPNRAAWSGARRAATTALQAIRCSPSGPLRQRTAASFTARRVPVTVSRRLSVRWRTLTRRPRNRRHSSTECSGRSRPGVLTSRV